MGYQGAEREAARSERGGEKAFTYPVISQLSDSLDG